MDTVTLIRVISATLAGVEAGGGLAVGLRH
jgi:hypothetical protein